MHSLRPTLLTAPVRISLFTLSAWLLSLAVPRAAEAQQEPVAVIAVSGAERLLKDVDYVFESAGQPQFAEMIRGVIANFNELRGLDRERPAGVYLYFPAAGQKDPQPLFFFPVSNVDELLTSVRIGNALRLERGDAEDRLTLHTEDGEFPVLLRYGYAFLDPTKSAVRFRQLLADPAQLLQGALEHHDAALIVRREGIPPFLLEAALGQLRGESVKAAQQKRGESDVEFVIRRDATQSLIGLAEAVVTDWRSATVGLRLSAEDRIAELEASVAFAADGDTLQFLGGITARGTQFSRQLAEISAFSISTNSQPTQAGRELLRLALAALRGQVTQQFANTDEQMRSAVEGVLDAFDATAGAGQFDAFVRLTGTPPNGFVLLGGVAVAEAEKVAAGLEQLLPFAAGSKDIRSIEMDVGRAGDVAIHRMVPKNLRKQDQRLYGTQAAIYLAAGEGALWLAIGDEGAIDRLIGAIEAPSPEAAAVLARPRINRSPAAVAPAGPVLFSVTMHATDWVGFARTGGGGTNARLAELARAAFADPDEDRFHLSLTPTSDGLRLHVTLDHGYVRLFGLALSEKLQAD